MSDLVQCGVCWYHRTVIPATDGAYYDKLVSPEVLRWTVHVLLLVVVQEGAACCLLLNLEWIKTLVFTISRRPQLLTSSSWILLNTVKQPRLSVAGVITTEEEGKWNLFRVIFLLWKSVSFAFCPVGAFWYFAGTESTRGGIGLILCFPSLDVFFPIRSVITLRHCFGARENVLAVTAALCDFQPV